MIKFKNELYWLHSSEISGCYNISPLNHYDNNGKLTANALIDLSYAILWNGNVMQFGKIIGKESDLEYINEQ